MILQNSGVDLEFEVERGGGMIVFLTLAVGSRSGQDGVEFEE